MAKFVKNYDCGLRLIVEEMPNYKSVAAAVTVNVGSSDEQKNEHGLSHFCEHMLFKGTKRRTGEEITKELSSLGVEYNAWTSENATCYHTKGIRENTENCCDILADMYFNLQFNKEDFDKESSVIVQEIAMHEDNPRSVLMELANMTFFAGTKYEHPIAGTAKEVKGYKPDDIYNYIKKHYVPAKTVVSFSGDIDAAAAERLVQKYFLCNWSGIKGEAAVNVNNPENSLQPQSKTVSKKKKTEQQNVMLTFPVCNVYNDDKYALSMLGSIFSGDMSSRLFVNVRERLGLVYTIMGGTELTEIGGYYFIYFSCTPENTKIVIETVKNEIAKILNAGVTEEELQKVKNIKKTGILFESENTEAVNSRNTRELIQYGKIKTNEEIFEIINNITTAKVNEIAEKYLNVNRVITAVVGR
jgi:predicted Zn-dependent peptidase